MNNSTMHRLMKTVVSLLLITIMVSSSALEVLAQEIPPVYSNIISVGEDVEPGEESVLSAMEQLLADHGGLAYVSINSNNTKAFVSPGLEKEYGEVGAGYALATGYYVSEPSAPGISISFVDTEDNLHSAYLPVSVVSIPEQSQQSIADSLMADATRFADAEKKVPLPVIAFTKAGAEDEAIITEAAQRVIDMISALPETIAITPEEIEPLYQAWLAYHALPEDERAMVDNAQKLETLWAFMRSSLPAEVILVVDAIDALPGEIVTQEDMDALQEVLQLLMALSDEQLALVYNVSKLWALSGGILPLGTGLEISYPVRWVWDDNGNELGSRPKTVTLTLHANGAPYAGEGGTVEVNTAMETYEWTGLPETDGEDNPFEYSVKQSSARGYRTSYAYDEENGEMVITNQILEGSLVLKLMEGSDFRIRYSDTTDVLTVMAQYTTYLANEKQNLRIILPPFFDLAAPPNSGDDYKVTTQTVALPAEYYPGGDAELLKAEPAARTNCKQITVAFDETVSGNFVLTFGIIINPNTSTSSAMHYLSELMVKYGENPDRIPLKIIAIAEDAQGVLLNDAVYHGTSAITTADGSAAFESTVSFPRSNAVSALATTLGNNYSTRTQAGYLYNAVALGAQYSANSGLAAFTNWHYPYTNMYFYFPLPENVSVGYIMGQGAAPGTTANNFWLEEAVEIQGKQYAKIGVNNDYTLNIYNAPRIPNVYSTSYYYDALTYIFPDMDTLLPGEVFEMGDVYVDYLHKGVNYEKVKVWSLSNYTVPAYTAPNFTYTFLTNSGGFENTAVWQERLQGQKADQYRVTWVNQAQNNLTYVYEDASVCIEFPYEVVPTSINCTGKHSMSLSNYTGLPALEETVYPNSVSYWVYGEDEEHTIQMTGSSVTLPDVHISKVALNYDTLFSASQYTYTVVANNGKVDASGYDLSERHPVQLKTSLVTKTGTRLKAAEDTDKREEEAYTLSSTQAFYLIQYPDALLFGTYYTSSYKTRTVLCYNGQNSYRYNGSYLWRFSLTKSKSQMKDYEDVKITIKPQDEESNKAMSKIAGFYVDSGYLTFASRVLIYYKTNKTGDGYRTYAVTNQGNNILPLDSDEYVVDEIVFDLGKIDGSKMTATSTANISLSGDAWYHSSTQHSIYPLLNEYRYYYAGNNAVANDYPVQSTDSHTLVATVSTSSAAKHITGQGLSGNEKSNKSSTGTVKYVTMWTSSMSKTATNTTSNWSNPSKVYYRGDTMKYTMAFSSFLMGSVTWAGGTYYHSYDDLRLYLEVQNGFSLSSLSGFELLEVRPLDTGNNLYVYRLQSARVAAGTTIVSSAAATVVVLPDAPIGIRSIIVNAGFCVDGFVRDYMTPEDSYYLEDPYYKYNMLTNRYFPDDWNIAREEAPEQTNDPYGYAQYQVIFGYGTSTDVTIQVANVDRIAILPGVAGAVQANPAEFYDYQKENLLAHAWMSNSSESNIAQYEAVFELPRKGQTTVGYSDGKVTGSMNDFSLYLKGPVSFGNGKPEAGKYRIVYYSGSGEVDPASAADWQSVTKVHVFLDDFPALTTYDCIFNLMTDEVKVGNQTADIFAYMGAGRRYVLSEDITGDLESQEFLYSNPAEFAFKSLWLKVRVGLDRNENGAYSANLSNAAEITVYYQDQDESEQVLYQSSTGYLHNIQVNADVTRVTARVLDSYQSQYVITRQNGEGLLESQDSDFPREMPNQASSLDVDTMDLVGTTTASNKYDVNLTCLPTVTAADLYLRSNQSLPAVITLGYSTNPIAKYKVSYELVGPEGIAAMTEDGMATGMAKGETRYRVTVTNLLGTLPCDTVTAEANIFVIDDFRIAMRAFWDDNYNGERDADEEIVTFADIAVAQEYFWLATSNSVSTTYKQPSRDAIYDSADGYYSFQVPSLVQYYAIARNPAGTSITADNAARFAPTKPVISGATAGYSTFRGGATDFGSVTYKFGTMSYDDGNLLLTTYIDFPIERPHTVTFKAENGQVVTGTTPTSNMILVNGTSLQENPITGETFTQKRYWNKSILGNLYTAAQVTPDEGYTWTAGTGSPAYNMRNWKRTDDGSNALKPEYSGWYSQAVTGDMTLVAVPGKTTLHARIFCDENRNGVWDEGEEILQNPTLYLVPGAGSYSATAGRITLESNEDSTYSSAAIPNIDMNLWAFYGGSTGANDCTKTDAMRFATAAVSLSGQPATIKPMASTTNYAGLRTDYTAHVGDEDIYVDIALQRPYTVIFKAENGEVIGGSNTNVTYTSHIVNYDTGNTVQTDEQGNKFIETKWWPGSVMSSMVYYAQVTPGPQYSWAASNSTRQWRREAADVSEVKTESVWNSFAINANMTFVALPTRVKYNVTYRLAGGVNHASNPSEYSITGTFPVVINAPTRTGYDFEGWTVDYDNNVDHIDITVPTKVFSIVKGTTGDIELTATWKPTEYNITYAGLDGSGITAPSPQPDSYNVETPETDREVGDPGRMGYDFMGWDVDYDQSACTLLDATGQFAYGVPMDAMGNITLTAIWKPIVYDIEYVLNSGTNDPDNPEHYTVEDLALPIDPPAREHYAFLGWTVKYDSGADPVENKTTVYAIPAGTTETVTLTAHWEPVTYNIYYQGLGETGVTMPSPQPDSYNVETLEEDRDVGDPSRKGYRFVGWDVDYTLASGLGDDSGVSGYSVPEDATGDITLKAIWDEIEYVIHYDGLTGAANPNPMPTAIKVTDAAKQVGNPTRLGYIFLGWKVEFDDGDQMDEENPQEDYLIPSGVAGDVWLLANWAREDDYRIIYEGLDEIGVTLPNPQPFAYNVDTEPEEREVGDPSRIGYDFMGWDVEYTLASDLEAATEVTDYKVPASATGDITLTAVWSPIVYDIEYVLNDGTNDSSNPGDYTVEDLELPIAPPARDYYTFAGWTVKYEDGTDPLETRTVSYSIPEGTTETVTLTAHWDPIEYDIIYHGLDLPNVTLPNAQPDTYNVKTLEADRNVDDPSRLGYDFQGWTVAYTPASGLPGLAAQFSYSVPTEATGAITLTAVWNLITYDIAYDLDNGTNAPGNPEQYTVEDLELPIDEPTRSGYTFAGWTVVYVDGTEPLTTSTTSYEIPKNTTGTVTLTAHWDVVTYNITYVNLSGVLAENPDPMPLTYTVLELAKPVGAPAWKGFTFQGWKVDYESTNLTDITVADRLYAAIPTGTTGDVTLTAEWTEDQYTIHYDGLTGNAADDPAPMPTTIKVTDAEKPVGTPSRLGYLFQGWTVRFDDTAHTEVDRPVADYIIPSGVAGDVYLTAHWDREADYQIIYAGLKVSNVTMPNPQPIAYNVDTLSDDRNVGDPSRLGYNFKGWTVHYAETSGQMNMTEQFDYHVPELATGDITLTAVWEAIEYDIAYKLNSGTNAESNPLQYTVEELPLSILAPTRAHYTFTGWTVVYEDGTPPVTTETVNYAIPADTTETVTLTAHWSPMGYPIEYLGLTGTPADNPRPMPITYTVESYPSVGAPQKNGYDFKGWTVVYEDGTPDVTAPSLSYEAIPSGVTGLVQLRANWTPVIYNIDYRGLAGATEPNPKPTEYTIEQTLETPSIRVGRPSRVGYAFKGWKVAYANAGIRDVDTPVLDYSVPEYATERITLTAQWSALVYNVSYKMNGGVNAPTNPKTYRVTDALPMAIINPTRAGYVFLGWGVDYTEASGLADLTDTIGYAIPFGATGDIVLTARWLLENYTITYHGLAEADAFSPKPVTYSVEQPFPIIVGNPTRAGHTFLGWMVDYANVQLTDIHTPKVNYAVPAGTTGDIALTAMWRQNPVGYTPIVTKTVTGDDASTFSFTFTLTRDTGTYPMPAGASGHTQTVSRKGPGLVEFGRLVFEKIGTYTYTIQEKDLKQRWMTYDSEAIVLTVEVTDNGGVLQANAVYAKNGRPVPDPAFNNIYKIERGWLQITKTVTGTGGDTAQGFPFRVTLSPAGTNFPAMNGNGEIVRVKSGDTIYLRHGQTFTIFDIPEDTSYTVSETNSYGHTVSSTGARGTIQRNATATAAFTNTLDIIEPFTLTINYWYDSVGGSVAAPKYTKVYTSGTTYGVQSPYLPGWSPSVGRVSGKITADTTVDVVYTQQSYTLTIHYIYTNGRTASPTQTLTNLRYGDPYDFVSPGISGFHASTERVTGTMPARNMELTVIYSSRQRGDGLVNLLDDNIPLGLGTVVMNVGDIID